MKHYIKSSTRSILYPALLPLLLAGCNPSFMPAGYTYHREDFKAPPGPMADDIGYTYTPEMNAQILGLWRQIGSDMIHALQTETGVQPGQSVYLVYDRPNAFNASYDHALRNALHEAGYTITATQADADIVLSATAVREEDRKLGTRNVTFNGDRLPEPVYKSENPHHFVMGLQARQGDKVLGWAEHTYAIPAYGYVSGEGQPGFPVIPSSPR